jgi:hypothetical protein
MVSSGRSNIPSIVREVGWSQRHFMAQFKHELAVTPKVRADPQLDSSLRAPSIRVRSRGEVL